MLEVTPPPSLATEQGNVNSRIRIEQHDCVSSFDVCITLMVGRQTSLRTRMLLFHYRMLPVLLWIFEIWTILK